MQGASARLLLSVALVCFPPPAAAVRRAMMGGGGGGGGKTCNTVGNCNGHGTCTPNKSGGSCQCKGEYSGKKCQNDPCSRANCHHGSCSVSSDSHRCSCDSGWSTRSAPSGECDHATGCDGSKNDCGTHGTCQPSGGGHTCQCKVGWKGSKCSQGTGCDGDPCTGHGTCTNNGGAFSCNCNPGWSGERCDHGTGCQNNPCGDHGTCTATGGSYTCHCNSGWSGQRCDQGTGCQNNPCGDHGTCTANGGGYTCNCDSGWSGQRCDQGTGCQNNPCLNGGTCTPDGSAHSCACASGWSGDQTCDHATGCDEDPCLNGGTCVATGGAHSCACASGWSGDQTCDHATGCDEDPCLNGGKCVATGGAYNCTCVEGWRGDTCDQGTGCDKQPCGDRTHGTCSADGGRNTCSCAATYYVPPTDHGQKSESCKLCEPGSITNKPTAATDCTPCPNGTFSEISSDLVCKDCAENTFSGRGKASCTSCTQVPQCPDDKLTCTTVRNSRCKSPSDCACGYTSDDTCSAVMCTDNSSIKFFTKDSADIPISASFSESCSGGRFDPDASSGGQQCKVTCNAGFTRSSSDTVSSSKTYYCQPPPSSDMQNAKSGMWRPGDTASKQVKCNDARSDSSQELQCNRVHCSDTESAVSLKDLAKKYSPNSFSRTSFDKRHPSTEAQTALRSVLQQNWCGDASDTETRRYEDSCTVECLPSLYPKKTIVASGSVDHGSHTYTCQAPDEPAAGGRWARAGPAVVCEPGRMSVNKSYWDDGRKKWEDASVKQTHRQRQWKKSSQFEGSSLCRGKSGSKNCFDGFQLAPLSGPIFSFEFAVRDEYGLTRNYDVLNEYDKHPEDGIVFVIERVPVSRLSQQEADLQPVKTWLDEADISKPWQDYRQVIANVKGNTLCDEPKFTESLCAVMPCRFNSCGTGSDTSQRSDGKWHALHQFTEHGIFFVSVYLCTREEYDVCGNAAEQSPLDMQSPEWKKRLVPGTGLPSNNLTALPATTFTVCPQGTEPVTTTENTQVVNGAQLQNCKASAGFYSPLGPGHIADWCDTRGMDCSQRGMTWPVAKPGYWVGMESPAQMLECSRLGACPGSSLFAAPKLEGGVQCPTQSGGEGYDDSLLDTFKKDGSGSHYDDIVKERASDKCFIDGVKLDVGDSKATLLKPECEEKVGHRCCPGSKTLTSPCSDCCTVNDRATGKHQSCNGKQWRVISTGEGDHCAQCPEVPLTIKNVAAVLLFLALLIPFFVKMSQLSKHAGAVSGPVLAILNFCQSAELFQGIALNWPTEFKQLARQFLSMFNFNFEGLLQFLGLPSLACAFRLTYIQKWLLTMASPVLIALASLLAVFLWILFWKALRVNKLCRCLKSRVQSRLSVPDSDGQSPGQRARLSDLLDHEMQQPLLAATSEVGGWHYRTWSEADGGSWQAFNHEQQVLLNIAAVSQEDPLSLSIEGVEYDIDVKSLTMVDTQTGRRRKISPPLRGLARAFVMHDWDETVRGTSRIVLIFLMVGYTFLAGTAMEPLACKTQLDGTQSIARAPDIECAWCSSTTYGVVDTTSTANDHPDRLSYRTLASLSIAMTSMYGIGTPILFGIILFSHRETLQTNEFTKMFGFLSTKMQSSFFWWEIFISLRKLTLVTATKFSDAYELPCALLNMFVLIGAFGAQLWKQPFANTDANIAETFTLLAAILTLILVVAQPQLSSHAVSDVETVVDDISDFMKVVNRIIYALMGALVGFSVLIVCRRMIGSCFNFRNLKKLEEAEADGRQVPNEIRVMLDRKWILVATAWAAIKAKEAGDNTDAAVVGDRMVSPTGAVGVVQAVDEQNQAYMLELADGQVMRAPIADTQKEGDIDRMRRVFKSAQEFQKREEMKRWESILSDWESFFPPKDRRIMHVWGPLASIDTIEDMVWFMRQLHAMEAEQHRLKLPLCLSRKADQADEFLKSEWLNSSSTTNGALGASLSLSANQELDFAPTVPRLSAKNKLLGPTAHAGTHAVSRSDGRTDVDDAAGDFIRFSSIAQGLIDDQQSSGLTKSCAELVRKAKEFVYRNCLGTRLRATGTCVWSLLSTSYTIYCGFRFVVAEMHEREMAFDGAQQSDNCKGDSSAKWLALLFGYWALILILLPICLLWRRHCRRHGRCCCSCRSAREGSEMVGLLSFRTHGIDGRARDSSRSDEPEPELATADNIFGGAE